MNEQPFALDRRAFIGGSALIGAAAVAFSPSLAFADPTAADKQAEAQATLAQLNAMQQELDIASNNHYAAVEEVNAAQAKMDECQTRIDEINVRIAEVQEMLGNRARSMYTSGSSTFLDFVMGATSFTELTQNWNILTDLNQHDADMVQESKDLRAEQQEQKDELAYQKKVAEEKAAEAERVKQQAEATVAEMQAVYNNLSAEAAALLEAEREAQLRAEEEAADQVVEDASNGTTPTPGGGGGNSQPEPPYIPSNGGSAVDRAYAYIGHAEYEWNACRPGAFDCSGFVSYCLTGSYTRLGNTYTFLTWPRVSDPQPGDVAVNESHCGIYVGGGQMVHAATYGVGVVQGPVQAGMVFVRY